jgi:hypothetical protein
MFFFVRFPVLDIVLISYLFHIANITIDSLQSNFTRPQRLFVGARGVGLDCDSKWSLSLGGLPSVEGKVAVKTLFTYYYYYSFLHFYNCFYFVICLVFFFFCWYLLDYCARLSTSRRICIDTQCTIQQFIARSSNV